MIAAARGPLERAWLAATPGVFVLLWSTGYLGARLGTPYVEPMTFLFMRFAAASLLLVAAALVTGARWPSLRDTGHAAVAGLLLQGVYLGGVFAAVDRGLHVGIAALVVGLQPVLTALLAMVVLRERVSRAQALGLALGFAGLTLVVGGGGGGVVDAANLALAIAALLGITVGTLYQKRFCTHLNLLSGNAVQFAASAAGTGALSLLLETRRVDWSWELALALAWLVLVLSIGAVSLLYGLIRRGAATRVSSLFYLVPPVTALSGWLLFAQPVGIPALAGMAVAAAGVALVMRGPRPAD